MSNQSIWEKENRELRAVLATWKETAGRKHERIAELEAQNDERLKIWNESITITAAQIDAAWEFNGDSDAETRAHGEAMLYSCFGIERCEECGGSGEKDEYPDPNDDLPAPGPCPDCNGHKWKKEKK